MTNLPAPKADNGAPVTVDNSSGRVLPTRAKRIDLKSIDDVRLEMATVYRQMRNGQIETTDGTKLCFVLSNIGKLIEMHDIEKRIALLEQKNHGNT